MFAPLLAARGLSLARGLATMAPRAATLAPSLMNTMNNKFNDKANHLMRGINDLQSFAAQQQAPPAYQQQAPPAYQQQAPPAYQQQAPPAYQQAYQQPQMPFFRGGSRRLSKKTICLIIMILVIIVVVVVLCITYSKPAKTDSFRIDPFLSSHRYE